MSYFLLENYIKLVLKEKVNAKIKLNIFDFDHTLYNPEKKFWLKDICQKVEESLSSQNTITILCTARHKDLKEETINMLEEKFPKEFDDYLFNTEEESRAIYKSKAIKSFLKENPDITHIEFWDDKKDNLNAVKEIIKKEYPQIKIKTNLVKEA